MQKMMASSSELTLDCKPQSHSLLLKSFGDHQQQDQNTQRLEEFLSRLEEERLKIDAFKRELPLCMQLLTNAMETSRLQLNNYRSNQVSRPVLEEFIPLKNPASDGSEKASDKANWMTSAQLWSQGGDETKPQTTITSLKEQEIGLGVGPKLDLDVTNQRNNGVGNGAFHPFSKERNQQITNPSRVLPELALVSVDKEMEDKKCFEVDNGGVRNCSTRENSGSGGGGPVDSSTGNGGAATTSTTTQNHRKARRCWSPDLHRRFVNALQMLGGSQVATPKQIRELMKVDGLTNDEVKSHLQKYRLHTRRPSPSPQAAGNQAPQLVVLGGIWVPPEYAAAAAAAHGGAPPTIYSAHPSTHPSQQYCVTPQVPQEFYAAQPPPGHQLHHHHLHHQHQQNLHRQLQLYKSSSQNQSSPESEVRVTGDRSESIEDGKSESSSWNKGDSGVENEGERERKGLVTLREEGSHGSDQITLKF